jgi:ferredoxin
MEQKVFFINKANFLKLLNNLSKEYNVLTPTGEKDYFWEEFKESFQFNKYRATTSLRQFLIPSREYINAYFTSSVKRRKPFCIVGAKNCDLVSLKIQDYVFLEGEADSTYSSLRQNNLIISSDCTWFKEVCFCLAIEIDPYPKDLFDLNLSEVREGYLVEAGSDKGVGVIENNTDLFEKATGRQFIEKDGKRKEVVEGLLSQLKSQNIPAKNSLYKLIKDGYENEVWQDEALKCVECGACIMNCPTCHCFLLFDTSDEKGYFRGRIWDGCQYKNFTRVAGGANPLKLRQQRLRNRYIKKFEFFPDNLNLYACTGCGRCIESCPGKIDLREIFRELHKELSLKNKD